MTTTISDENFGDRETGHAQSPFHVALRERSYATEGLARGGRDSSLRSG